LAIAFLAGCGGRGPSEPDPGEANRIAGQIQKQAQQIEQQAANGTAAIEQALENESAILFENREALLNEAATNGSNAAAPKQ
jgi:outer membrane biogenesis lipoprotein LolB